MGTLTKFLDYVRANKWRMRFFIFIIGIVVGSSYSLINSTYSIYSNSLEIIQNSITYSSIAMYLIYIFLAGYAKKIYSILPKISKKIVNIKIFCFWIIFLFGWIIIGIWLIVAHFIPTSSVFIWVYSLFALIVIYPCIASLAIYVPSFRYLRLSSYEFDKKRNIVNSLVIITVALAAPWIYAINLILIFFFLSTFLIFHLWLGYYVAVASYIVIFFIAIDLPYYQSMEDIKKRKVKGLKLIRERLVEKLCDINLTERVAVELNIDRIDRDIQTETAKSSHPYSIIKSLGAFVIVTVLGGMFANLLAELIIIVPH